MKKEYTIKVTKYRYGMDNYVKEWTGTVDELTQIFSYTLLKGKSWEYESGNKKINMHPKTAVSLVNNLNAASNNAASNGHSGEFFSLVR